MAESARFQQSRMTFGMCLKVAHCLKCKLDRKLIADVAKLVYALDLGSSGATRESSSLSVRTIFLLSSEE